jgi:hypothetical protein
VEEENSAMTEREKLKRDFDELNAFDPAQLG